MIYDTSLNQWVDHEHDNYALKNEVATPTDIESIKTDLNRLVSYYNSLISTQESKSQNITSQLTDELKTLEKQIVSKSQELFDKFNKRSLDLGNGVIDAGTFNEPLSEIVIDAGGFGKDSPITLKEDNIKSELKSYSDEQVSNIKSTLETSLRELVFKDDFLKQVKVIDAELSQKLSELPQHFHKEYALKVDLDNLAVKDHKHSEYALKTSLNGLASIKDIPRDYVTPTQLNKAITANKPDISKIDKKFEQTFKSISEINKQAILAEKVDAILRGKIDVLGKEIKSNKPNLKNYIDKPSLDNRLIEKANLNHRHVISQVTGLEDALNSILPYIRTLGWVSVKDMGAKGDGVTDDLAAVQAAINKIQLTGGTLYYPKGQYVMGGIPTINFGSNILVTGDRDAEILLAPAAMVADGHTIGIWVNGGTNIFIDGLKINGNFSNIAKNGTYQSASALWSPVISEYGATSVKVYKMAGSGIDAETYLRQRMPIRVTNSTDVFISNCYLYNSVSAGIVVDSTSKNGCKDILITNNRIKLTWDNGIYFHQGVQYATAANNIISDTTYNGVSCVYCDNIIVNGNNIRKAGPSDSDSGGVQMNGSTNSVVNGNIISECQFYGIDVLSTQETDIIGGNAGLSVWGRNTVITNNSITGCHANDYPSHNAPGINLFGAQDTNIAGNSIDDCDFGISMGFHAINTAVLNNRISKCSSIGLNIGTAVDLVNIYVKGNYIAYNGSHGIYTSPEARIESNTIVGNDGMGINLTQQPTGIPSKVDYIINNTILDNTDSGVYANGGTGNVAFIKGNTFGNSSGTVFYDGVIANGDNTFQSATASFAASDVGKVLVLVNQGTDDIPTATTISSVTNSTTVELANPAVATQSGLTFYIGRGAQFFTGGSTTDVSNSVLTASGNFTSEDVGKTIQLYKGSNVGVCIFAGSINSVTNSTTVVLSGNAGANTGLKVVIDRSRNQMVRAINKGSGEVIDEDNTVWGIPELLDGATIFRVSSTVKNVSTSTDNNIPRFDGTTGTVIQGSGATIDDNGNLVTTGNIHTGNDDTYIGADDASTPRIGLLKKSGGAPFFALGKDENFFIKRNDSNNSISPSDSYTTLFTIGTDGKMTVDKKIKTNTGYQSVDGSDGISTTVTTASLSGKTITIKDGLITGFA